MVKPRCVDGRADVHVEIDYVHQDAQNRIDNRPTAGAAGDEHDFAVLGNNRRGHRAKHAFSGRDLIGHGANAAFAVGDSGPPVEVHHLVVKEETGAADHDP